MTCPEHGQPGCLVPEQAGNLPGNPGRLVGMRKFGGVVFVAVAGVLLAPPAAGALTELTYALWLPARTVRWHRRARLSSGHSILVIRQPRGRCLGCSSGCLATRSEGEEGDSDGDEGLGVGRVGEVTSQCAEGDHQADRWDDADQQVRRGW